MNALVERLRGGGPVAALVVASGSPIVVEMAGDLRFSAVVIDGRHGPVSPYSHHFEDLARAGRAGDVAVFSFVPESTPGTINRALNDGAQGVIVPGVRSADEARDIVRAGRYPPIGDRGANPSIRAAHYTLLPWDTFWEQSNGSCLLFAGVETDEGLRAVEEVVRVEGLDGLVFDVATFAVAAGAQGRGPDQLPDVVSAVEATRAAGLVAGVAVDDVTDARAWAAVGATFVLLESDVLACGRAMQAAVAPIKAIVSTRSERGSM